MPPQCSQRATRTDILGPLPCRGWGPPAYLLRQGKEVVVLGTGAMSVEVFLPWSFIAMLLSACPRRRCREEHRGLREHVPECRACSDSGAVVVRVPRFTSAGERARGCERLMQRGGVVAAGGWSPMQVSGMNTVSTWRFAWASARSPYQRPAQSQTAFGDRLAVLGPRTSGLPSRPCNTCGVP